MSSRLKACASVCKCVLVYLLLLLPHYILNLIVITDIIFLLYYILVTINQLYYIQWENVAVLCIPPLHPAFETGSPWQGVACRNQIWWARGVIFRWMEYKYTCLKIKYPFINFTIILIEVFWIESRQQPPARIEWFNSAYL